MILTRLGIVADPGGFVLKRQLVTRLHATGHETIDFGAHSVDPEEDHPDVVVPLSRAGNRRRTPKRRCNLRQRGQPRRH
jgi:ribose 5-phosphate isomerase B